MTPDLGVKNPKVRALRLRAIRARYRRIGALRPWMRAWLRAIDDDWTLRVPHRDRRLLMRGYVDAAVCAAIAGSWTPADAAASEELRRRYADREDD